MSAASTTEFDQNYDKIRARFRQAQAFLERGQPVISVDARKKELVGEFTNAGRTWQPKGQPLRVQVHDFPSMSVGKAVPYGIYDVAQNCGFVNVGTSHDTPDFAAESIRGWWEQEGRARYLLADSLLVLPDNGGSNGPRSRLWKVRLQEVADELQLPITVCHLPPGTSRWNKIACLPTSAFTSAVGHWSTLKRSSVSSALRARPLG